MINATISRNGLRISGHAGAAPYGQDIVCAAVSALVQTFMIGAEAFTHDSVEADVEPNTGQIKGFIWKEEPSEKLRVLVDTLWLGLSTIADEYPQYVKTNIQW